MGVTIGAGNGAVVGEAWVFCESPKPAAMDGSGRGA